MSKASNVVRSYLESGRFMSGYFSRLLLKKDFPQRLLISDQFSAEENQNFDYESMWGKNGSGLFSIEQGFWKNIDKSCAGSLAGYVPYVRGCTKIGVHHFWSVNYGLRKQLLGHVVLVKGGAFTASFRFLLPAYHFAVIDLEDLFGQQDGDVVYVEVYHPKIPVGHGGHNGQLRFWGMYGDHLSTVHSMPVAKSIFREAFFRSSRSTFPGEELSSGLGKSFFHWGARQRLLPSSLKHFAEATPFGYYLINRPGNAPATIWHSSAYTASVAPTGARFQAVAFPPVPSVDVVISFLEAIGSGGKVNLLLFKESKLIAHVTKFVEPDDQFLVSQLFPGIDLSGAFLVTDFSEHGQCIHSGYLHLIYRVQDHICDCVHSHWLQASRFKGAGKNEVLRQKGSSQSLKFMHFTANDAYQAWLAVWTLDESVPAKLRFLTTNGNEYVLNIDIPPAGICYLNVSELFLQCDVNPCENVVVQFESGFANLDANLYTYTPTNKSLSVDHFTGG